MSRGIWPGKAGVGRSGRRPGRKFLRRAAGGGGRGRRRWRTMAMRRSGCGRRGAGGGCRRGAGAGGRMGTISIPGGRGSGERGTGGSRRGRGWLGEMGRRGASAGGGGRRRGGGGVEGRRGRADGRPFQHRRSIAQEFSSPSFLFLFLPPAYFSPASRPPPSPRRSPLPASTRWPTACSIPATPRAPSRSPGRCSRSLRRPRRRRCRYLRPRRRRWSGYVFLAAADAQATIVDASSSSILAQVANLRSTPTDLLWNLFVHAASQVSARP